MNNKEEAFKGFLFLLNKAYQDHSEEILGKRIYPQLSFVEIMKFLFFASVLDKSLLDVFNNWVALPKGPVESDLYNYLKSNTTIIQKAHDFGVNTYLDEELKKFEYKEKLEHIVNLDIYKIYLPQPENILVEKSHEWKAWETPFLNALSRGKRSSPMNISDIKNERCYL